MPALFAALESLCTNASRAAAALGMTRQAYGQARARGDLSPLYTVRAAILLGIDPARAILDSIAANLPDAERAALLNTTTPPPVAVAVLPTAPENAAAPILDAAPNLPCQPPVYMKPASFVYYVN